MENWEVLKTCIKTAADATLDRREKKQPEWFEDSLEDLIPLIEAKNKALQSGLPADKKDFRRHQRLVKKAVIEAKEKCMDMFSCQ